MPANMTPVTSTNLDSVGYDEAKRELYVTFRAGYGTYIYPEISPGEHESLMRATSIGSYFWHNIRSRNYRKE